MFLPPSTDQISGLNHVLPGQSDANLAKLSESYHFFSPVSNIQPTFYSFPDQETIRAIFAFYWKYITFAIVSIGK